MRNARQDAALDEVAAIGRGRGGIGQFEQAATGAARAPGLFGRQVAAPRSPARSVTRNKALGAGGDDGDGAGRVVVVPQVHALHAGR